MTAPTPRPFRWILLALASLVLAACGGGGGSDGGSGALRVSLTDAPACGYDAVFVTVSKVRVHQSANSGDNDAGWSEIVLNPPRRVDLLTLGNGVLLELGQTALPSGNYRQIRLVLADNTSVPFSNAVVPAGGPETELDTPSAQQSGLKLQANVEVPPGQTADVVLDFDACRSIVRRGNSGQFNLKPVVSVIPMVSAGTISGFAAGSAPAPASGVKVSAQQNGVVVKETTVASGAEFRLSPIAAGVYDLVFTAEDRTTRVIRGVPAFTAGNTVTSTSGAPIVLPASASGTIAGTVTPVAASARVRALQSLGVSGTIEVASDNADALTGDYALRVPTAPVEVASPIWPAPPIATPPAYLFSAVAGSGGNYGAQASAAGYLSITSAPLIVPAGGTMTRDFALVAAP